MPISIDQVCSLLDSIRIRHLRPPERDDLALALFACAGRDIVLAINLMNEGQFLQFVSRDAGMAPPPGTAAGDAALREIAHLNVTNMFIKIGVDPSGQILIFGDMWIKDGSLAKGQFEEMIDNFTSLASHSIKRIGDAVRTGSTSHDRGRRPVEPDDIPDDE